MTKYDQNLKKSTKSIVDENYSHVMAFLNELQSRIEKWTDAKLILKDLEIPCSTGWLTTIQKVDKEYGRNSFNPSVISKKKMREILHEISLISHKSTFAYRLNCQVETEKVIENLFSDQAQDNIFSEKYPYSVSEEELKNIDHEPYFCGETQKSGVTYFQFSTKRTFTEKTQININNFSQDDKKILEKYEKIIGTREKIEQFFDTIVVNPKNNIIEIRIDKGDSVSQADLNKAHNTLESLVIDELRKLMESDFSLEPINFFPMIRNLYDNKEEGRVCEIGFECPNNSVHFQHHRKKREDIRSETFHDGGLKAIGEIDPFRLAVIWDIPITDESTKEIEALLPGTRRMLSEINPQLPYVVVKHCLNSHDFERTIERILEA